jgi:adenylosuccinate lyase
VCQSAHKWGTDLRLLAHEQEVEEPFEQGQVGSSAMAYKRNPMRSERMCGLARYVVSLATSAAQTASVQWLERSLDDSVNRRLTLPQAFLATDGVLRLALNLAGGLVVNPGVIARHVAEALPFMVTENVLMEAVSRGGNRQELHEKIRKASLTMAEELKAGAARNELLERLAKDPAFAEVPFERIRDAAGLVGRAPEQVDEFLAREVEPLRARYGALLEQAAEVSV